MHFRNVPVVSSFVETVNSRNKAHAKFKAFTVCNIIRFCYKEIGSWEIKNNNFWELKIELKRNIEYKKIKVVRRNCKDKKQTLHEKDFYGIYGTSNIMILIMVFMCLQDTPPLPHGCISCYFSATAVFTFGNFGRDYQSQKNLPSFIHCLSIYMLATNICTASSPKNTTGWKDWNILGEISQPQHVSPSVQC